MEHMDKQEFTANLNTFESLCSFVEKQDIDSIIKTVSNVLAIDPAKLLNSPMGSFTRVVNTDGSFAKGSGCYALVLNDVKQNLSEYKHAYSLLCDDISREVFLNQMRFRIMPNIGYIRAAYELSSKHSQYFDTDIFHFSKDEVIVDCGGYIGDTTEEFIARCPDYRNIYVYEPFAENFHKCCTNLAKFDRLQIRHAGVGRQSSRMLFSGDGSAGSFLSLNTQSDDDAEEFCIISLDEDIKEPVTFIKMDVECFEPDAIRGAAEHIKNDSPKLAICLYHVITDLWEIPKTINEINPNYDYYLRHYCEEDNWEYVLYAIPGIKNRGRCNVHTRKNSDVTKELTGFLSETDPYIEQVDDLSLETAAELYDMLDDAARFVTLNVRDVDLELRVEICSRQDNVLERIVDKLPSFEHSGIPLRVCTPAFHKDKLWENVDLMKDCGLSVYMLAKEIGATPVMYFGTEPSDYPYLSVLPEMEMLYYDSKSDVEEVYTQHLIKSHSEIDVLILFGMYDLSMGYLDAYRTLRPDGKVYCSLDMNRFWMEWVYWDNAQGRKFAEQCDVIATSCRSMRDALNRNPKVYFPCRWFTNGFYNPMSIPIVCDSERKENVILTVGRIGTKQKNNEELLSVFAQVSEKIGNWSLRLVGSIEPDFQNYISKYFFDNPHLKDRVIFTGPITDKKKLYNEYSIAKIFALTSNAEGFPNVYAEALFHGCMFVTSDVDAADDMTNCGELGVKYPLGDVEALSSALVETCGKADKQGMQRHIPKALAYAGRYFDWERNAKKLAYMLFK